MWPFKKRAKRQEIPATIYGRISLASVIIYRTLSRLELYGKEIRNKDKYLWESISFILAFLTEKSILSFESCDVIKDEISKSYKNVDEKVDSHAWISFGFWFYKKELRKYITNEHNSPDVIVFNLSHTDSISRKTFDDLPLFSIDIFKTVEAWTVICRCLADLFFRDGEEIKSVPLL